MCQALISYLLVENIAPGAPSCLVTCQNDHSTCEIINLPLLYNSVILKLLTSKIKLSHFNSSHVEMAMDEQGSNTLILVFFLREKFLSHFPFHPCGENSPHFPHLIFLEKNNIILISFQSLYAICKGRDKSEKGWVKNMFIYVLVLLLSVEILIILIFAFIKIFFFVRRNKDLVLHVELSFVIP